MNTQTYHVEGMTCDHCVGSVTREVAAVAGVADTTVDLASGTLTVMVDAPVDDGAIAAAVTEAGYALAPRP